MNLKSPRNWILIGIAGALLALGALFMGCARPAPPPATVAAQPLALSVAQTAPGAWTPHVWTAFLAHGPTGGHLPDFSYAGYAMGDQPIPEISGPVFDATAPPFGAVPTDGRDDTAAIQAAIDAAGAAGGGVVYLPRGRYEIHPTVNAPFLCITQAHIVLRGQGSGPDGTILYLGAPAPAKRVRRLGRVPARQEARHGAVVAVLGPESSQVLAIYTSDLPRGARRISVSDTRRLSAGQTVAIEFTDPWIDPRNPEPQKADLAAQLTAPYRLVPGQVDTFGAEAKTHTWLVQINAIVDQYTLLLAKPARFHQWRRYQPRLLTFEGVRQVGIEHLRIQSGWPGGYQHHKPYLGADGQVVRSAREQDYLWNGIWISSAVDSWVRNVAFHNLTQGVIISRSGQITLEQLQFHGHDGHAGVTMAHSNDILVNGIDFYARMVHPVTVKNMAAGNVVTNGRAHYDGRDPRSGTDAVIDFHGLFPYENLFEQLAGFYVCPGGDLSVLPHAGVRNVFWNVRAPRHMNCYTGAQDTEFFRTYDYASTSSASPATMFEQCPQAFYIGLQRPQGAPITAGGTAQDQHGPWLTVEGFNRPNLAIPALYHAQWRLRHERSAVRKP
jgi:hypothetical protein